MQEMILSYLDYITFFIGLIGIIVITFGVLKGIWFYMTRHSFWEIRVVLVKHILLGLDFLIGRDIIETVILKSSSALWIDLAVLVLIIAIRVVFTVFAEKEMNELMKEHKDNKWLQHKS